jgi:uncharacterized cupredoxin-like copper-binding protein
MNPKHMIPIATAAGAVALFAAGCGSGGNDSSKPAASSSGATSAKATSSNSITATENEWSISTNTKSVKAGAVKLTVTNDGKVAHELVVLRTGKAADALGSGTRISESDSAGEAGGIAPGATKTVTLKLTPGHYSLVCNLPAHYKSGMHTDLTVT